MSCANRFSVLCIILSLACGACATDSGRSRAPSYSFEQLKQMGESYLTAGDNARALKYLLQANEKRPNDPEIQYDLGLAYGARGMSEVALTHFEKALTLQPDFAEASNAVGILYAQKGQLDKAQQAFEKALADPTYRTPSYALYNLGLISERRGDLQAALNQYRKAVQLQPNYAPAYYRLGLMLENLGRSDEALQAFGKAIESNPNMAEAYLHFGMMSYHLGEIKSAVSALQHVVQLNPYSPMANEARETLARIKNDDTP